MRALALFSLFASVAALASPVAAQVDPCAGGLDPARIIECLRPGGITTTTRGIRPSNAPAAARPTATPAPAPTPAPAQARAAAPQPEMSSVDLSVPFDFNSAELTPQGTAVLAALGTALKDPSLASAKFRIAGHTDGVGTDDYNRVLSERRAEAARRYLVEAGGVDPSRLTAIGYGRRQLYDAANPTAAANRRVQVIRLDN